MKQITKFIKEGLKIGSKTKVHNYDVVTEDILNDILKNTFGEYYVTKYDITETFMWEDIIKKDIDERTVDLDNCYQTCCLLKKDLKKADKVLKNVPGVIYTITSDDKRIPSGRKFRGVNYVYILCEKR